MVLATDEVYTYAIFNYGQLSWSAHTEAGGDTTGGEGGVPAFVRIHTIIQRIIIPVRLSNTFLSCPQVGFNAGNGTQAYEYRPYSQASVIRDLSGRGWANGFPGRHIFRIDERIMLGTCNKDIGEDEDRTTNHNSGGLNNIIPSLPSLLHLLFCRRRQSAAGLCTRVRQHVGRNDSQHHGTLLRAQRSRVLSLRHRGGYWRVRGPEPRRLRATVHDGAGICALRDFGGHGEVQVEGTLLCR